MIKACLIGKSLGHSYSPLIHSHFGYSYENVEIAENKIEELLKNGSYNCFNVTVPYKKTVMQYLELSEHARKIGAVNTIVRKNGILYGYNTDYYGFKHLIEDNSVSVRGKKVIVLGTGGASAVVQAYMHDEGANVTVIGRKEENNYNNLYLHYDAEIIINTTPVGMYPNNLSAPIDLKPFTKCQFVGDVIYNPFKTALLLQADELGIPNANGLGMLIHQAIEAAKLFTGEEYCDKYGEIYKKLSLNERNIMLIGMPSSGKSTVGRSLASKLNRDLIDLDKEIIRKEKRDIPDIFKYNGEKYFRKVENALLEEFSKLSGKVIALGGGTVMGNNAYQMIKQNSIVVYLTRTEVSFKGRPILMKGGDEAYQKLLLERTPVYQALADIQIDNDSSLDETTNKIIGALNENCGN